MAREFLMDEDVGDLQARCPFTGRADGADDGVAHFRADEGVFGVGDGDDDVTGVDVGTPVSVEGGIHSHGGVDAPHVYGAVHDVEVARQGHPSWKC